MLSAALECRVLILPHIAFVVCRFHKALGICEVVGIRAPLWLFCSLHRNDWHGQSHKQIKHTHTQTKHNQIDQTRTFIIYEGMASTMTTFWSITVYRLSEIRKTTPHFASTYKGKRSEPRRPSVCQPEPHDCHWRVACTRHLSPERVEEPFAPPHRILA